MDVSTRAHRVVVTPTCGHSTEHEQRGSQVQEVTQAVTQQIEGLNIEWMTVSPDSDYVGRSIAEGAFRTRTGASIVAVVRGDTTVPAPEPTYTFTAGEVVVAVGTGDGLAQLEALLAP